MNPLQMDNFNFNNSVKRSENDTWPFYVSIFINNVTGFHYCHY